MTDEKAPTTDESPTEGEAPKMATATPTRKRSTAKSGTAKSATKKTTTAASAKKATAAAKKVTAASKPTPKAESLLGLAVAYMRGKKPMIASDIAKGVLKTNKVGGKDPAYNIAFALHKAAREGHTVKRTNDRPALYSLR